MSEKVYSFQTIDKALMVKINTFPDGMDRDLRKQFDWCSLIRFSVLNPEDPEKEVIQRKIFEEGFDDIKMDRAVGSVLGMPLGDSLGAPMEFSAIRYGSDELQDMGQEDIWKGKRYNHFGLRPGQWTDDASMGLCIADSLLVNRGFNPLDLRLRFYNWVHLGYNNAFGYDKKPRHSIGLGGNISMSISEFTRRQIPFTEAGDIKTSGNGSVMRLSPAPVYFWNNIEDAMLYSYQQSKTTHQGDEAAECCRLLAWVIVTAINWEGTPTAIQVLDALSAEDSPFKSPLYAVTCLSKGIPEERHEENEHLTLADRNWNWKDPEFRYSPHRARVQPGYVGSYAMDATAMALHCVYSTTSLKEAMLKAANLCGDADSVTSVVGQVCGAIYGCSAIPKHWIRFMQQWDNNGDIALRAYKIYTKNPL